MRTAFLNSEAGWRGREKGAVWPACSYREVFAAHASLYVSRSNTSRILEFHRPAHANTVSPSRLPQGARCNS